MSLWQLQAAVDGWNTAQGGEDDGTGMTVERLRELNPPATMH